MQLCEILELGKDIQAHEEDAEQSRQQQRDCRMTTLSVLPPRVVNTQHLPPPEQHHRNDQTGVVEAGKIRRAGEPEHDARADEGRHGVTGEGPDDRGGQEK